MKTYMKFENKDKWSAYVHRYMTYAERTEGVHQTILTNDSQETIAVWQDCGLGHIYEGRSKERLSP